MKIAIGQINTVPSDFKGNFIKIKDCTDRAINEGADLIVFPELALSGYMNQDIIYTGEFLSLNEEYLKKVSNLSNRIGILIGHISTKKRMGTFNRDDISSLRFGGTIEYYNSATFFYEKRQVFLYSKQRLPEFDIFNEKRYFETGNKIGIFKFKGKKLGINICEDIWHKNGPYEDEATGGAEIIINISASPFYINKPLIRFMMIREKVRKYKKFTIYANAVGGQDHLIYDGNSMVFNSNSKLVATGKPFEEDLIIADTGIDREVKIKHDYNEQLLNAIILGIRDYFKKNNIKKAIVGLSGGVDSALVATLCGIAIGSENVLCVFMPSRFTSRLSTRLVDKFIKRQGMKKIVVPINKPYSTLKEELVTYYSGSFLPFENIQSRLRGSILMFIANTYAGAVVATGNKNEIALGYNTLYGDTVGALAPIGDLYKDEVISLCYFINSEYGNIIPEEIIKRTPTAELRKNQKDEDDLPPYSVTNRLLRLMIEENRTDNELIKMGFDRKIIDFVHNAIRRSEFKRYQMPPILKLKPKTFGSGRKIPITHRFEHIR